LYADNSGSPAAQLALTNSYASYATNAIVNLDFPSPVTLTSGYYWIFAAGTMDIAGCIGCAEVASVQVNVILNENGLPSTLVGASLAQFGVGQLGYSMWLNVVPCPVAGVQFTPTLDLQDADSTGFRVHLACDSTIAGVSYYNGPFVTGAAQAALYADNSNSPAAQLALTNSYASYATNAIVNLDFPSPVALSRILLDICRWNHGYCWMPWMR